MTTAIDLRFSQIPAARATGGATGYRDAGNADATAFGDLVQDKRGAQNAPVRSGEATEAVPDADRRESGRTRHRPKSDADESAGGETGDEREPDAAGPGDAQPLRDRLPLLATLTELDHRGAGSAAKAGGKPEGMSRTGNAARAGATAGQAPASAKAGDRSKAHAPDAAGRQTAPPDPAAPDTADLIASVMRSGRPPEAAAAAFASQPRPQGRLEDGGNPSSSTAASHVSRNATDRLADKSEAAPLPGAPADGSQGDASPDGQQGGDDKGARQARAETWMPARDGSPREPDRIARNGTERQPSGSVNVVSDRSFPAPAAHPLSQTAAGVVDALAIAGNQAPASALSQLPQAGTVAHPAQILRIELHPAELGMVTASLRMSGEQLSIELKPETAEAYRHLARDSEAIVTSLRKLGLDVDSVTVIQPSIATQPAVRADAGNQSGAAAGRDAGQFQSGTPGGGDGSGGQQSGRNRGHDGQAIDRPVPAHRERARGSLFI